MDSTLLYKILRTHDIDEPGVNPVPTDETLKAATDPYAMIRILTIYDERHQNTAGQENRGVCSTIFLGFSRSHIFTDFADPSFFTFLIMQTSSWKIYIQL